MRNVLECIGLNWNVGSPFVGNPLRKIMSDNQQKHFKHQNNNHNIKGKHKKIEC